MGKGNLRFLTEQVDRFKRNSVLLGKIKQAMKHFLMILALNLGLVVVAQTAEERATAQTDKMKTSLNLSAEQYTKVYEINVGIIRKNDDTKNSTYSDEVKKEIHRSNEQARRAMLKDVLTAAQYEKLAKEGKKAVKKKRKAKKE
ncbi:MAG: hypothetical protein EBR54_06685 [Flavobacteriia bacterium]|nr:hypothetical protein [Flavobacteriia bacterium]NBX39080.1 hypothetical protein [Flavobacteriia bacterium]